MKQALKIPPLLLCGAILTAHAQEERFVPTSSPSFAVADPSRPVMSSNVRSSITPSTSSRAGRIFFQSGFEENWTFGAPPGWIGTTPNSDSSWHRNDYTTGWSSAAGFVNGYVWSFMGGFSARFHTAGTPAGRHGVMTTPDIDLSAAADSVFLSFWWTNSGSSATMLDSLKMFLSTDGGSTFPIYLGFVGPTGNPWVRAIAYLPSQSSRTRIKFQANSDGSSSDILLDEVIVFQKGAAFSGTLTLPGIFANLTDAARQLTLYGVTGPTQINVQAGTYTDSVTFPPIQGASATHQIVFKSVDGVVTVQRGGVLTASTTSVGVTVQRTDDATISLWGTDYMTFNGIGIADKPGTGQNDWGYHIRSFVPTDGATNNTIRNCTIVMNIANTSTVGIEQETFWAVSSQAGAASRNRYYNLTIRSCAVRGIALVGNPPYLDTDNEIGTIEGGTTRIANLGGPGLSPSAVQISAQSGVRVYGVTIDSMFVVSTSLPAIFIGGSATSADSVVNFEVYNNTIRGIVNSGPDVNGIISAIRVGFSSTPPTTQFRGRIDNNCAYDLRSTGTRTDGSIIAFYQHATSASTVEWFHNTVYLDNQIIGPSGVNTLFRLNAGTALARNNILVNRSATVGAGLNYVYYKVGGTLVASNNAVYVDTTSANDFVGRDGIDYRTLTAWQSSAAGRDTLSVLHNPRFRNIASLPYNLHVDSTFSTPLESGGAILSAVTSDIDGQARFPYPGYPVNPLFPPTGPDIGADEFGGAPLDVTAPTILYNPLTNTTSTSNRTFGNVSIADASGINISLGLKPRVYFKRSSNANTYADNTSATNGWKYTEALGASSPFTFILNYSLLYPNGSVAAGDTIQYFVVAQDLSIPPNVAVNGGTFNSLPSSVALTSAAFPIGGAINRYLIVSATFSGTYNVGAGQTYTTLTGAGGFFQAVNGGVLSGNVTAMIVSDVVEAATNSLREWGETGGSGFTLTIRPLGSLRTLRGNIDGPLIDLNGSDRVTIDGGISGTKSLRIRNESAGTNASTINCHGNATNNVMTNCIIEGSGIGDSSGTVVFGPATIGNNSNIISQNEIRDRSDSTAIPSNAILSLSVRNEANAIQNNAVFNWSQNAVRLPESLAGNGWRITGNSIYQTAPRSTPLRAISVESGSGHTVAGNSIGGSATDRGGNALTTSFGSPNALAFVGVFLIAGGDSATVVSGNTIANISSTTSVGLAFEGMHIAAGRANISGNTIGGSINPWDTVSTISTVPGVIHCAGGTVALLSDNVIANVRTRDSVLCGISLTGSGSCTAAGNTLRDLLSGSTVSPLRGMNILTPGSIVERNTLYNLANTSTGTSPSIVVSGIHVASQTPSAPVTHVRRNWIYDLSVSGTGLGANGPRVLGISVEGENIVHAYNNMVALGTGVAGDLRLSGIEDAGSARNKWYDNSVRVAGQHPVVGTNSTAAFARSGTAPDTLRDNIFCNVRTRGTRGHFAIATSSAVNWNPGTSNYNLFYTTNADSVVRWLTTGYSLAGWRGVSGGDGNSLFGDPCFVSASDLHIRTDTISLASNSAIPIAGILDDFDGDQRSSRTPDIGADEFGPPVAVEDASTTKPTGFWLGQNSPNPFNPETNIKFSVEQRGRATLEVFNVLGERVATMFDDVVEAGVYRTVKLRGTSLASGIYICRLSSGGNSALKKVMLIK